MKKLFLIKHCDVKPEHHNAPYHPIIICDRKPVAEWRQGSSDDQAWVWMKSGWNKNPSGWLLVRWSGLDIDYGPVVHSITMPDGSMAAFWRDYQRWPEGVGGLIERAIWWSDRKMPDWLDVRGVQYPPDRFTQQQVLDDVTKDDCTGVPRREPAFWHPLNEPQMLDVV